MKLRNRLIAGDRPGRAAVILALVLCVALALSASALASSRLPTVPVSVPTT